MEKYWDEITFEEWEEKYKPLRDEDGIIMVTDCPAKEFINENSTNIWTLLVASKTEALLLAGIFYVNRYHYVYSEIPFSEEKRGKTCVDIDTADYVKKYTSC